VRLAILLCIASRLFGAQGFVNAAIHEALDDVSVSISLTSPNAVYCLTQASNTSVITSVGADDGAGHTFSLTGATQFSDIANMQWFYAIRVVTTATYTITSSYTAGGTFRAITCYEVSGVPATGVVDVNNAAGTAGSGTSCTTASFSTAQASEVVVVGVAPAAASQTFSAGAGYTMPAISMTFSGSEYQAFSSPQAGVAATDNYSSNVASMCLAFSMKDNAATASIPMRSIQ
jgi:hypothetical protein